MIYKKRGITIVETIVALLIIIMSIPIATILISKSQDSVVMRRSKYDIDSISYCIMEELKYNYTIDEIKSKSKNNTILLSYNENFLENIKTKELFSFPEGNDIRITLKNNISDKSLYLTVTIYNKVSGEYEKREFIKSGWMDYEL